jgi:hypothetical protein
MNETADQTAAPDRPPMDGGRSDDVAMLSCPVWLEHGDDQNNDPPTPPVMGMYLTARPDPALLFDTSTGDQWNEPDLREGAYDLIQQCLEDTYKADGDDCSIEWNVQDISWSKGEAEVAIEVEFSAGMYREGESLDAWTDRVVAGTPFFRVYNEHVLLFTGQQQIEDVLRKAQGLPALCRWCHGAKVMQTSDRPCGRCEGSGIDPEQDAS